jgi:hypothetical protein
LAYTPALLSYFAYHYRMHLSPLIMDLQGVPHHLVLSQKYRMAIYGSPTNAQNPPLFTLCMHDFTDRWRHRFTVDQFVFKTTLCNVATL